MRLMVRIGAGVVLMASMLVMAAGTASASAPTIKVHNGESIQDALNSAPPGATVSVASGTYNENLLIITNGITLTGRNVVLHEPGSPNDFPCNEGPSAITGICVVSPGSDRISDVTITGLTVEGFSGEGIITFHAKNFDVHNTTSRNNGGYGIASFDVDNVTYYGDTTDNNNEAGIYVGDSVNSSASVKDNKSRNNVGEGILFRDSRDGTIQRNTVKDNCIGILALDTGAPNNGGGVIIDNNTVFRNNKNCPGGDGPPGGGLGIGVGGDDNVRVRDNDVTKNVQQPGGIPGGGIVLFDTTCFGGGRTPNNNK